MQVSEFKAWLEGLAEGLNGPPDAETWKKIINRVRTLPADGNTTVIIKPAPAPVYYPALPQISLPNGPGLPYVLPTVIC